MISIAITGQAIPTTITRRATIEMTMTETTGIIGKREGSTNVRDSTAEQRHRQRSICFPDHQEKVSKARLAAEKGSSRSMVERC